MKWYPLLLLILGSVDSNGQVTLDWVARYQGIPGNPSVSSARDIVLDREGNLYVTGQAVPDYNHFNVLTIKYNRDGNVLWQRFYEGPRHFDFGITLALDGMGHVYVAGASPSAPGHSHEIVLLKYDTADGNFQWERRYRGSLANDVPSAIAVDSAGDIYVAGGSNDWQYHSEFLTLKYSADGTQLWEQHYTNPFMRSEIVNDMQLDEVGNVYITGPSSSDPQSRTWATLSYTPDGTVRWVQRYQGGVQNVPIRIAVDRQGNSHVTGTSITFSSATYLTVKYDSKGNLVWEQRYGDAGVGRAIAVSESGEVYVTGDLELAGTRKFATLQYSSEGILNWARTLDDLPQPFDGRISLKLDAFGSAYITATSGMLLNEAYTTFKYSRDGTLLWEDKFGVENSTYNPYGIAVDSCGNAYVTGLAQQEGGGWDWATVKYRSVDGVCL